MAPTIIVSYDGTKTDEDALALGRLLADAGADLSLAYVRHTPPSGRDELDELAARELLSRGARAIGLPDAPCHVVRSPSTGEGLWALAEHVQADVVVFGSEYRTAAGTVRAGTSAQRLLEGGPVAVALAPAGLRHLPPRPPATIGLLADDAAAAATAYALAAAVGATVAGIPDPAVAAEPMVDLLVVGSRPGTAAGRLLLSAASANAIDGAAAPVLAVAREASIAFGAETPVLA